MIIENKRVEAHDDAYAQGIRSFNVVRLDEPGVSHPHNIFVSRDSDAGKAARDMYWAIHQPPYDSAVWMPPDESISFTFRQEIHELMDQNANAFSDITFEKKHDRFTLPRVKDKLRSIKSRFQRYNRSSPLIAQWIAVNSSILSDFTSEFHEAKLMVSYRHRDHRNAGYRELGLHLDNDFFYNNSDWLQNSEGLRVRICKKIRFLWSQNDTGVYIADRHDVDFEFNPETNRKSFTFMNQNPTLYAAPPWSISMVLPIYHDRPPVHSSPISTPDNPLKRMLWDCSFVFDEASLLNSSEEFWTQYKNALPQLPLFDGPLRG